MYRGSLAGKRWTKPTLLVATAGTFAAVFMGASGLGSNVQARGPTVTSDTRTQNVVVEPRAVKLAPSLAKLKKDSPVTYRNGCHLRPGQSKPKICTYGKKKAAKRVLLFGDSHAASWFGAADQISKSSNYRLLNLTKSSCSSVPYAGKSDCRKWRKASLANISNGKFGRIDVAIVSNKAPGQSPSGAVQRGWEKGLEQTLAALSKRAKQIIVLRDQPSLPIGSKYASCLKKNIKAPARCGAPISKSVSPATWRVEQKAVARYPKASAVDLTTGVCTGGFCNPVKGRYIVMRDDHHFSQTFVRKVLTSKLKPHLVTAMRRAN